MIKNPEHLEPYTSQEARRILGGIAAPTLRVYRDKGILKWVGHGKWSRTSVDQLAGIPPEDRARYILNFTPLQSAGSTHGILLYLPQSEDPTLKEHAFDDLLRLLSDHKWIETIYLVEGNWPKALEAALKRVLHKIVLFPSSLILPADKWLVEFSTSQGVRDWLNEAKYNTQGLVDQIESTLTHFLYERSMNPTLVFLDDLEPKLSNIILKDTSLYIIQRQELVPLTEGTRRQAPELIDLGFDPEAGRETMGIQYISAMADWNRQDELVMKYFQHCLNSYAANLQKLYDWTDQFPDNKDLLISEIANEVESVQRMEGFNPLHFRDIVSICIPEGHNRCRSMSQLTSIMRRANQLTTEILSPSLYTMYLN